ncbi:MAG: hypothetical protein WC249_00675 [Patescibacteria group bacterium]|jgi:peptidoglycan hydrolase CwlO-like protein
MKKLVLSLCLIVLILPLLVGALKSQAQISPDQSLQTEKTRLEQQLRDIERQIVQNEQSLSQVQSQKNTLANKIRQLGLQRAGLVLKIKALSVNLDHSTVQLTQVQFQIEQNQQKILTLQQHLATIIDELWRTQQFSLFNLLLSINSFADFYNGIRNLESVSVNINKLLQSLRDQKNQLQRNRQLLVDEREKQQNFAVIINLQNSQVAKNIQDQNNLLAQTKGQESNYQILLKQNKQRAVAIRNRIYSLATVGVASQITFGQAVQIAQATSGQTGVRAALLLAVLTQESNLGRNVGTCNRQGDPPSKSWKVVMSPSRDQGPFIQITKELGLNINITLVSCPMHDKNGKQLGWGGAMGPAQFIPSTWLGYKSAIAAITGRTANPWDIRDAFLAAGLKLKADGAATLSGEWAAAMRYFSGSTNPVYSFYGDSVIATATQYQNDINELNSK